MPYGAVVTQPPRPGMAMRRPSVTGRALSQRVFGFQGYSDGGYGGGLGDFWSDVYAIGGAVSGVAGAVKTISGTGQPITVQTVASGVTTAAQAAALQAQAQSGLQKVSQYGWLLPVALGGILLLVVASSRR